MTHPSMQSLAEAYLDLRRKLGCALQREGALLLAFARFADHTGHRGFLTTELAVRWAKQPQAANPIWWARRLDVVRRFARRQLALEPRTEIPPPRLLGPSYRRPQPHVFSADEIAALLRQVAKEWGRTVVMVTHDPHLASFADRILFLKDGAIIAETRPDKNNTNNAELVAERMREIG